MQWRERSSFIGLRALASWAAATSCAVAFSISVGVSSALALAPGDMIVVDAFAFGGCTQGCGGLIAVDSTTGAESTMSSNSMPVNAQSPFMNAPFTLALESNGSILVGETAGLGGSCQGGVRGSWRSTRAW